MTTTDSTSAAIALRPLRAGNARFTVLSPALIRLEWSPTGAAEDRPTQAFPDRDARVGDCSFSLRSLSGEAIDASVFAESGGEYETAELVLRYDPGASSGGAFTAESLSIRVKREPGTTWTPGADDSANLGGTTRTLDNVSGAAPLENGLLSRDGWAVYDDSRLPVFVRPGPGEASWHGEPWPRARDAEPEAVDWYFFGYGHDYTRALGDFASISGPIPLPPRYTLGVWWSRYWRYTDNELKDIVGDFERHGVPLDVLVIDMDWHLKGWTGYTWDPACFPDPEGFLGWCHDKGLFVTLNLHPADGVGKHEAAFNAMRSAVGGGSTMYRVPFDCTDPVYVKPYFELLHHPLEDQGVDFWWMDWQQGRETKVEHLDPLPWLNHLHWRDMELNPRRAVERDGSSHVTPTDRGHRTGDEADEVGGKLRPLVFSRWGGLGGHRYPIGFSGDTYNDWASLAFQPRFTATASNVGFGYWSHDIGGHQPGPVEPELYARWIQYGALSPILRTHAGNRADAERRIWTFPEETFRVALEAFRLRYELAPYVYGMNRRAYDCGVSLCRPMYYEHPESDAAYVADEQYMFGDDLLAAPVVAAADSISGLAVSRVWLPRGEWTEWFSGRTYAIDEAEGRHVSVLARLDEIPLFVRGGAVIPTAPAAERVYSGAAERLVLNIFPGEEGEAHVYDDDGLTDDYRVGRCAWTHVRHGAEAGSAFLRRVHIGPALAGRSPVEAKGLAAEGGVRDFPMHRFYEVRLHGVTDAESVSIGSDRLERLPHADAASATAPIRRGFFYDKSERTLHVLLPETSTATAVDVEVSHVDEMDELRRIRAGARGTDRRRALLPGDGSLRDFCERHGVAVKLSASPEAEGSGCGAGDAESAGRIRVRFEAHYVPAERESGPVTIDACFERLSCFRVVVGTLDLGPTKLEADGSIVHEAVLEPVDEVAGNDVLAVRAHVEAAFGERTLEQSLTLCPSVNSWRVIGPFFVPFEDGMRTAFSPETELLDRGEIDVTRAHETEDGRRLEWTAAQRPPWAATADEFVCDLNDALGGQHDYCVAYARAVVRSPRDMAARLVLGSDDGCVVYVNGREVFRHHIQRGFTSREQQLAIDLREGANELVVKIEQAEAGWMFAMHIEDAENRPIPGLRYSID